MQIHTDQGIGETLRGNALAAADAAGGDKASQAKNEGIAQKENGKWATDISDS